MHNYYPLYINVSHEYISIVRGIYTIAISITLKTKKELEKALTIKKESDSIQSLCQQFNLQLQ